MNSENLIEKAEETAYEDGFFDMIDIMSKTGYTLRNTLLVYAQTDHLQGALQDLKTKEQWQKLGRIIRDESKAITITIPVLTKNTTGIDGLKDALEEYKEISVFDLSQTEGEKYNPVPKQLFLQNKYNSFVSKYILSQMTPSKISKQEEQKLPIEFNLETGEMSFTSFIDEKDILPALIYAQTKNNFWSQKPKEITEEYKEKAEFVSHLVGYSVAMQVGTEYPYIKDIKKDIKTVFEKNKETINFIHQQSIKQLQKAKTIVEKHRQTEKKQVSQKINEKER